MRPDTNRKEIKEFSSSALKLQEMEASVIKVPVRWTAMKVSPFQLPVPEMNQPGPKDPSNYFVWGLYGTLFSRHP